ncbi:RNA ligase family protein [Streptomyces sp. NPDC088554]|uniref:RNA ligase family protein n=1 Tax=Streptomyces sp. NPDC088554 TaxID=3365865 RepID=UPI0037FA5CA1
MHEFTEWPKTKRLFRDIVVTEKLDGTNSAVHLTPVADWEADPISTVPGDGSLHVVDVDGVQWAVTAQSRKRIITPGKTTDNYGFAGWVYDNAAGLVRILGEGLHFGEWWGQGIQRGYGMEEKRFSLFNTARWFATGEDGLDSMSTRACTSALAGQIGAVPVLYSGTFAEAAICQALTDLGDYGSVASPGFTNPEGICVFHSQTRNVFKVTLDNQDAGKWESTA